MSPVMDLVAAYLAVGLLIAGAVKANDRAASRWVVCAVFVAWPIVAAFLVISTLVLYLLGMEITRHG